LAYSKEASFIAGKQEYWMQKFTSIHAHILYHDNKNDEAILSLEGVNTLLQQDAITAKLFGDAKFKTGDKPTAVKYWKLASTLGFNTSALKEQIHAAGS